MAEPNILDTILAGKRDEVADRSSRRPLPEVIAAARDAEPPRNFFKALTRDPEGGRGGGKRMNVIAEVKKASPSAGVIAHDFDPTARALAYAEAGADALSVLTDEEHFRGSLDFLPPIKAAVDLPVLRKDFIVDTYQVWESRAAGADAVLLIAEALETNELIDLQILATELHMTTLLEVHSLENLMRVRDHVIGFPHKSYSLLGINNRDLTTFRTDLGTTTRMAELVEDRHTLVSESGIGCRADVDRLVAAGVRSALVGESLMRSGDVSASMRDWFGV